MPDFTVSSDLDALLTKQTLAEAKTYLGVTANETAITTETTRATAAEGVNATNIATNATAISDETTRATAAEAVNATAISDETTRATAAEGVNAADIATNATDIATETTRATAAEVVNATAISTNATNIATNATDISDETTRALGAEAQNRLLINNEVVRATAAEGVNATAIVAEAVIRADADTIGLGLITANTTDISTNTTDITTNETAIAAEETRALAAEALLAPIASPTFTGDVTAPRLITNEIQSVGTTTGTAQPITYDSKEHRFRDYDETPSNLMVIKKADGVPIGKVGINHNDPKCALHVVGGHSTGGMADEALRVVGAGLLTSDDETTLVLAMDTDDTANTSDPILKIKRDEREASTGNVEEMNLGFVGANSLYTNQTLNAGYIQVEGGRKFEIATGASSARRLQVSDAGVDITGTATLSEDVKLSDFTSTSRSTGATALDPIQNNQPASDDTITELCVDPSGNVVRGSQEATWTFTRAQLNALTSVRVNLLNSPGADKCVVVEETNWLIEVDLTKTHQLTDVTLKCEMLGTSANSVATQITKDNLNNVSGILSVANTNSFGLYHRDVPDLARIYRFDVPMTIRATTGTGSAGTFPDNFVSVKLKIKYRVFDSTTF